MFSQTINAFSTQIGSEYILEIIGTESEFKDKKLYFHCLICKKYDFPSKIEDHKISNAHRIKFLEIHYPALAKAIQTRKLHACSVKSLLSCVFNAIYENYRDFEPICPQVYQSKYTDNEADINSAILEIKRSYNPSDEFAITMEKFIETEYELADDLPETIEIPDETPEEKAAIADPVMKKPLTDKEIAALQSAIDHRMKIEISNINMKYAKYQEDLTKCPDYLPDWRDFYLTYSSRLSSCGVIDKKFYNYIGLFHNYFRKQLDSKKQNEIEMRRKDVTNSLKNGKDLNNVSDDEDDCDVKIIEELPETYSVSSHDEDDDFDEPAAKKQKPNECTLSVPQMMRAIKIAHVLHQKGEKPTPEGVKRAFKKPTMPPLKPDLSSTADFYNRPNDCLIDEFSPSIDFYSSTPSVPKSNSRLGEREKFMAARVHLHDAVPYLTDDEILILNKKSHALPKIEKRHFESELLQMKVREPYRYEYLSKIMKEDDWM